jgi:hypothetical protein
LMFRFSLNEALFLFVSFLFSFESQEYFFQLSGDLSPSPVTGLKVFSSDGTFKFHTYCNTRPPFLRLNPFWVVSASKHV